MMKNIVAIDDIPSTNAQVLKIPNDATYFAIVKYLHSIFHCSPDSYGFTEPDEFVQKRYEGIVLEHPMGKVSPAKIAILNGVRPFVKDKLVELIQM